MLWKLGITAGYLNVFFTKKFGKAQEFECQEKAKKLVENSKIMLMFKPHCSFQQFRHVKENISFPSVFAHYSNNIKVLLYPNMSTFLNPPACQKGPTHACPSIRLSVHLSIRQSVWNSCISESVCYFFLKFCTILLNQNRRKIIRLYFWWRFIFAPKWVK